MNTEDNNNIELILGEVLNLLPQIAFFGGLIETEVAPFLEDSHTTVFKKGETIFHEGDSPGNIYMILQGRVDILTTDEFIRTEKEGAVFGLASIIGIQKQFITAIAKEDTKVLVMSRSTYKKISKINPILFSKVTLNIAREFARDMKLLRDIILDRNLKNNSI